MLSEAKYLFISLGFWRIEILHVIQDDRKRTVALLSKAAPIVSVRDRLRPGLHILSCSRGASPGQVSRNHGKFREKPVVLSQRQPELP
jgi:hypothetical protein